MKLIAQDIVLKAMNVAGLSSVGSESVDQAVDTATTTLESTIRSPLLYSTRIDYFTISSDYLREAHNGVRLRLTQRFLADKVVVELKKQGTTFTLDFDAMTPYTTDLVHVDKDRGIVTILDSAIPQGSQSIAIKYTAGFKELDDRLPENIKAILVQIAIGLCYQSAVNSGSKKGNTKAHSQILRLAEDMTNLLVVPNSRLFVVPSFSTKVK